MEALSIGTLGLVLGFALGAVNLYYILQIVHRDIAGMRLAYEFPVPGDPRARADDPRGGVHRRDLAGGVGGARLARRGARI